MTSSTENAPQAQGESLSLEEKRFLEQLEKTNRTGLSKYAKSENISEENAKQRYHTLPFLFDPTLIDFAHKVLFQSPGPLVNGNTKFPSTVWLENVKGTYDGRDFLGNISQFVKLLEERATKIAPKKMGWVIEPTTNTDGHRVNESTVAMHALFLDCDGRGEWHTLLSRLERFSFAYIAYQSGGWSAEIPKWRVVLPLAEPFDTSTALKRENWKALYHYCRVIFGSIAELLGEGFDPKTDTPCNPWFLTERRNPNDTPRQIKWQPGHSLCLMSLALALPPIAAPEIHSAAASRTFSENSLTDEKFDEIIAELSKATASVPSDRHELYLALPGVLLDRGVPTDEVRAIIEAVSLNYPRSHPELHTDNMHGAETTISKWEAGSNFTRIGTLNGRWPEVAKAIDKVLPSVTALLAASTEKMLEEQACSVLPQGTLPSLQPKKRRRKLSILGKEILPIVASMKRSKNEKRRFAAKLVDRILDGDTFQVEGTTSEQVDALVCLAVEALGFDLPTATWIEILDLASATLLSMDFTQDVLRVNKAELAFMKGQRKKREWIVKQKQKFDAEQAQTQKFLNAAKENH